MVTGSNAKGGGRAAVAVLWLAIAAAIALLLPLRSVDVSVDIYGMRLDVWLVAVIFYLVGVVAGWASFRARQVERSA